MRPDLRMRWPVVDRAWLTVALIFYLPVSVVGVLWMLQRAGASPRHAVLFGRSHLESIVLGLAVGGLLHVLLRLSERTSGMRALHDALADHTHDLQRHTQIGVALLSGFGEEILFRGVLQSQWGLMVATLCFALVHVPVERRMAPWPLVAGLAGLAFGALTLYTGGVLAACIAHALSNGLSLRHLGKQSLTERYDANMLRPRL